MCELSEERSITIPNLLENLYKYHLHDVLSETFQKEAHNLPPGTKCRFLTSKGKNSKKNTLGLDTVILPQLETDEMSDRITIQYPKGSTYQLRKTFLFPILTTDYNIIVANETDFYRRMCWIHTQKNDGFIEIGCDMGFTVGEMVNVPRRLGIDKSAVSLQQLKSKYEHCPILQLDLLEEDPSVIQSIVDTYGMDDESLERNEGRLVVAIDINGNRDIEGVLACLDRVLKCWRPKLVIVKSRSLYNYLRLTNIEKV